MPKVYVDTSYHVAVLDRRDRLHSVAARALRELESTDTSLVTSEDVLLELLTYFSNWGSEARTAVARYCRMLRETDIEIIPQTQTLFDRALDRYERRPDKTYSAVDCIGMVICSENEITEVLTADHDFEQEGLTILLK